MQSKRLSRSVRLQQTMLGCYPAGRAAALSGIPRDRLHAWARAGVLVPSVAQARERLWSYTDLLALRLTWLRATAMPPGRGRRRDLPDPRAELRRALALLSDWMPEGRSPGLGGEPDEQPAPLLADWDGNLALHTGEGVADDDADDKWVDLFARFEVEEACGPDLVSPRPHLRIVPGKVAGEPHLAGSRLTTLSVAALARRGLSLEEIAALFPDQQRAALGEAVELEDELAAGPDAAGG